MLTSRSTEKMQQKVAATHYDARISKLRLPEQDSLKNEAERCSADPAALTAIGRAVGQQVRITRTDDAHFVAIYTVSEANPDQPPRANVVRTGQAGRERLGTDTELGATIVARVLDAPPLPNEPPGVRFFELAEDGADDTYFVAIAPHGGLIEPHTDEQAAATAAEVPLASPRRCGHAKGSGTRSKALPTASTSLPTTFTRHRSRCSGRSCRDDSPTASLSTVSRSRQARRISTSAGPHHGG